MDILRSNLSQEVFHELAHPVGVAENPLMTQLAAVLSHMFTVFMERFRGFSARCPVSIKKQFAYFLGVQLPKLFFSQVLSGRLENLFVQHAEILLN